MKKDQQTKAVTSRSDKRLFFWSALLLALLIAFIFGLVTAKIWTKSDYVSHVSLANDMADVGYIDSPTITYQQVTLIVRAMIPFTILRIFGSPFTDIFPRYSFEIAGFLTAILCYVVLGLMIFHRLKEENSKLPLRSLIPICIGVPLMLELITPINLFTLFNRDLYIGYIGITVFHNPTITLLKPITLILFWMSMDWLFFETKVNGRRKINAIISIALLVILSIFTKPNFILCFLPAIWVIILISIIRKKFVNWWILVCAITIPSILLLGLQYLVTYYSDIEGGIIFAPLQSMWQYVPSYFGLAFRLILSCLFPLIMFISFFKEIIKEKRLSVAYLTALFGLLFNYLFAETGTRAMHGNFWWGAQAALFVLFVELVLFLIRKYNPINFSAIKKWRFWLPAIVLLVHFFSGVVWYFAEVLRPHQWWGI